MKTLPLWSPSPTALENARVAKFMAEINADFGASCRTYADLHAFSIRETEAFWSKAWDFLGVIGERGTGPVFRPGERFEDAKFFEGARLNYAENLLRKNDDSPALIFWGEDKLKETLSWAALQAAVSQAQQALRARGVGEGDRVAALMPNMPEAIIGFLAASSLGAIWSSASPDFGVGGVLDRFGQIEPKLLIACDGYYYNGKTIPIGDKVLEIVEKIPSIEHALIVSYLGEPETILKRSSQGANLGLMRSAHSNRSLSSSLGCRFRHPALHSLFVRHDRHSEMHRAFGGRRADPADEGAPASLRFARGRAAFLLHHARLDDVELARRGAGVRRDARALRRLALPSQRQRLVRLRGCRPDRHVRHIGEMDRLRSRRRACARATRISCRRCG